ncbi:hypothetical protein BH20ACT21_BH20ACT21_14340 [soil metagenome]
MTSDLSFVVYNEADATVYSYARLWIQTVRGLSADSSPVSGRGRSV